MITNRPVLAHMPQLDGLRAIAVGGVVFHHIGLYYFGAKSPDAASAGVRLFFVLSGFLITGILLAARDNVRSGASTAKALKNFYLRRILRIFPIYYLTVLLAFIFDVGQTRDFVWWLVTYTLNLKIAAQGWYPGTFPHFWSLNVEEQFYIFWPWVVLLLPIRWLLPAVTTMIAVTPLGKIAFVLSGYTLFTGIGTYVGTWANLDTLGAGALIAILLHRGSRLVDPKGLPALAVAIGGGVILLLLPYWSGAAKAILESPAQAAVFAWVILKAAAGFTGPLGAVLKWKPVAFMGKISYGIYVYHPFVPGLLAFLFLGSSGKELSRSWPATAAAVVAILVLSAMSWFLIERPINRLKERFR